MSKKKIRVLFIAYSGTQWMGGVYYVKNIVYQFLEYAKSQNEIEYEALVFLDESVKNVFEFCVNYPNAKLIYKKKHSWDQGEDFINRNLRELGWILRVYGNGVDYIYPSFSTKSIYRKKIISWIPDFQHVKYSEFFSKEENDFRNEYFADIARNHSKLVLSSQDAFDTYKQLYPDNCNNVGVVHFVSALDEKSCTGNIDQLCEKYGIENKKFFIVSNQFYRHKNHIVLFDAIKRAKEDGASNIQLICTGLTKDNKDANFFGEVEKFVEENDLDKNVKILGLIPREDQLTLMFDAIAVIQPSLFEGWGTCTEDAKSMGKITVLSDIPVHREQADDKSIFFEKNNAQELAKIIEQLWEDYRDKEVVAKFGIDKAVNYGELFAKMLKS